MLHLSPPFAICNHRNPEERRPAKPVHLWRPVGLCSPATVGGLPLVDCGRDLARYRRAHTSATAWGQTAPTDTVSIGKPVGYKVHNLEKG
jgi:hypothetical protein